MSEANVAEEAAAIPLPHERFNFNLRIAKRIERKIIADVLNLVSRYGNPSEFAYIGMGSNTFADFSLMHRNFGMQRMISIEAEVRDKPRFEFNKPLGCIEMQFGMSHDVIPTLNVYREAPTISWLDYYGELDDKKLGDVEEIALHCLPGSAVLVTVNGQTPGSRARKIAEFEEGLSEENRPPDYSRALFANDVVFSDLLRRTLDMRLQAVLAQRNKGIVATQVFNFRYQDGKKMATFGWLLLSQDQLDHLNRKPTLLKGVGIASGDVPFEIDVPPLTFKELAHLRAILPENKKTPAYVSAAKPVPPEMAKAFAKLYRYYPTLAHIEE